MPQSIAELEKPDAFRRRQNVAVLIEVGKIGDAGAEPLLDSPADMAGRAIVFELAEMPRKRKLLLVGQILVAKHQHRVAVHPGFDRGDSVGRERAGAIDAADLAGEDRVERTDRNRHLRAPSRMTRAMIRRGTRQGNRWVRPQDIESLPRSVRISRARRRFSMPDHQHDHDHSELSDVELRVRALETILTEKGYVDPAALDLMVEAYETKIGPKNGARLVARAWVDPAFRTALLKDATEAANSLGHVSPVGSHLIALENTPQTHNLVVCTLCSCYPWEVLGLPPVWYKSAPYRSRAVIDPKGVLADFGVALPADTEIRIWDSTAETRFIVLPMQPPGSEGWSEERLAELVTRDSMIGTGLPQPAPGAKP